MKTFNTGFFRRYNRIKNFKIRGFTQANPLKHQFGINLRNHRKILVVDGHIAFTGGTNIAKENISQDGPPQIHDYHFEVTGPIVQELQYTFLRDWYAITEEEPSDLFTEDYFPENDQPGNALMRMLNSGPTSPDEPIASALFIAITQAQHQVLIVTPYFIPNDELLQALKSAALRGVDVRLILPEKNNHFYAGLASRALYEELLETGVNIYERPPPFSHAKAILVDDVLSIVGSANMDIRSLRLNFETCLSIYDEHFADTMKSIILSDQARSNQILLEPWKRRPLRHKIIENAASLLSPML